jgi:hypothetical protein
MPVRPFVAALALVVVGNRSSAVRSDSNAAALADRPTSGQ